MSFELSEQLPCRSAEVKFFSVFLCQRCREIWREILVNFFRATFSRVWVCDGKFHQNFTSKTVWKKQKISRKFHSAGAQRWELLLLPFRWSCGKAAKCRQKVCSSTRPPKIGTQKSSTKRDVREPLHVEIALNNRELVKAEVFEKRVFKQTAPLKWRKWRGHFSLNNHLVGTVRPPDYTLQHKSIAHCTWG